MLLRSEMREEVRERRRNQAEKGQEPGGRSGKFEFPRGGGREVATSRDYEERVTYRTITRTEFQKRRASFESQDEAIGDGRKETGAGDGKTDGTGTLRKKTRSLDRLTRKDDPYHVLHQEKEMTDKLEDIHRMIVDMQEMTRQLKDRNYFGGGKGEGKFQAKSIGETKEKTKELSGTTSPTEMNGFKEKSTQLSDPALTVKPVRYRSTILIAIGSKRQRFKEEIEVNIDSRNVR